MDKLMNKLKLFHSESFTTIVPILTPRVAGTALMVSPKTLAAAIIGKLTNEPEHDSGCNCDLCRYRELKKQAQCEVTEQRTKIFDFVGKITNFTKQDNDELDEDEVMYYYGWMSDNFPEIVYRYEDRDGPMALFGRIEASHKSKIDMTLLDIVVRNGRYTFLTDEEIERIISEHELNNQGLLDNWAILMEIAHERKEREEMGFEAALALDLP